MQPLVIEGQIAHNWSIGTPYGENDVLTLNIACAEWLETLKNGYSYVYLEKIDEQFIEEFGAAFENQSEIMQQALYSVEDVGGRTVLRLAF